MSNKKVALLILDGWGIGDGTHSDAISNANTPVMDKLMKEQPWSTLQTSGLAVGLPAGQMGNSEVGHLNIGAGRVVYQELVKINNSTENGEMAANPTLQSAFSYARENNKPVHFFGLLSDGCIHSSDKHLHHLIQLAEAANVQRFLCMPSQMVETQTRKVAPVLSKLWKKNSAIQEANWQLL
jgi:2,3-bisphosphoglycerate-independent phosphoglycerate mutase